MKKIVLILIMMFSLTIYLQAEETNVENNTLETKGRRRRNCN